MSGNRPQVSSIEPEIIPEKSARIIAGNQSKSSWYRYETGLKPSVGTFPPAFRLAGMPKNKYYKTADVRAWVNAQLQATE